MSPTKSEVPAITPMTPEELADLRAYIKDMGGHGVRARMLGWDEHGPRLLATVDALTVELAEEQRLQRVTHMQSCEWASESGRIANQRDALRKKCEALEAALQNYLVKGHTPTHEADGVHAKHGFCRACADNYAAAMDALAMKAAP